ncbi:unnamed protein product [Ectocarpus sp. 4 AP-2014]
MTTTKVHSFPTASPTQSTVLHNVCNRLLNVRSRHASGLCVGHPPTASQESLPSSNESTIKSDIQTAFVVIVPRLYCNVQSRPEYCMCPLLQHVQTRVLHCSRNHDCQ